MNAFEKERGVRGDGEAALVRRTCSTERDERSRAGVLREPSSDAPAHVLRHG